MNINNGFVVPFFTATVDDWSEYKNDILSSLDLEDGDGHLTDYFKYYQAGEIAPYTERMFEILDPAIKDFNELYPFDFQIFNMWAQKYTRGGYHPPHNHGALGYLSLIHISEPTRPL